MNEWKKAWRLLRDAAVDNTPRNCEAARTFLASCADPHLSRLAPLLTPPVSDKQLLCALVPVERRASRARLSDADLGISTTDPSPLTVNHLPFTVQVIADNIRSALNIGGIFRTCAFFGVSRLWLCGYTATPDNPHVAHSAMGAEKMYGRPPGLPQSVHDAIHAARSSGCSVYALETSLNATDISTWAPPPDRPLALVIGNERFGLDPETVALCDGALAIRGAGAKNSLNVVSALAIALFQCGKRAH